MKVTGENQESEGQTKGGPKDTAWKERAENELERRKEVQRVLRNIHAEHGKARDLLERTLQETIKADLAMDIEAFLRGGR